MVRAVSAAIVCGVLHSDALSTGVLTAIERTFGIADARVDWQRPAEREHGDLATPIALQLSKKLGKPPRDIAETLKTAIAQLPGVEKAEVAGAGYVNVWLTPSALLESLQDVSAAIEPKPLRKKEAPVIVDYSSPNIAKPLGIHHILSTIIGQTVVNLYTHAGYPVVRWNYLGDWGSQFGKLAVAYEKWGKSKPASQYTLDELLDLYVKFHDEAEKDESLETAGQEAFRKLEQGDPALRAFWKDTVTVTKSAMKAIYDRLSVSFDEELGESHYEDKMAPIVEEGKQKGVFKPGEKGALIVEFPEESKLPPAVVVKADGATLYLTRDLALMKDRFERYKPQSVLWAVDVAQQLYFQQLFATVGQLGWGGPHLEHMWFGRMRFADRSMSTRKGNILKLEHVLDEAVHRADEVIAARGDAIQTDDAADLAEMMGIGALVYGILSQNRKMDIVFDWDKMLSFEGNSAPYLQYTYARAKSVLRKAEVDAPALPKNPPALAEHDRALIKSLLSFPKALEDARRDHMPHTLANYLYALAQSFNAFYNAEPILKSEGGTRETRLFLTSLTSSVLRAGAALLTLRLPERM
jgi:arginyl-tRNA synthetase